MSSFLLIFFSVLFSYPNSYKLDRMSLDAKNSLSSNGIINIESLSNSEIYFGTSSGLGKVTINNDNNLFSMVHDEAMPEGGNPALIIKDNIIAVSGVTTFYSTLTQSNEPMGTGIAYSIDYGISWNFIEQPVVPNSDDRDYYEASWGGQLIQILAVTTAVNNVSYDLAIFGDHIYSTSWAGGLQRFNYTESSPVWEVIPLPMDNQDSLICGQIELGDYMLNPKDPIDGGNHNHKGFSVFIKDETIWIGTANGINKGIIDGECINWSHYTTNNGLSGNWVVGIDSSLNGLWAISWSTSNNESMGLSFSYDDGITWQPVNFFTDLDLKVYNIDITDTEIYASTVNGLYVSKDGNYWELIPDFIDSITSEVILDDAVYASHLIPESGNLWVGTGDGLAVRESSGIVDVIRFWEETQTIYEGDFNFSVYPNPFYYREQNIFNGSGHVRFIQNVGQSGVINIYNYSMDHVIRLENNNRVGTNNEYETIWNGKNSNGNLVSNGVYFCKLSVNDKDYWLKLAVVGW